jgi:hypothetical protein
VRGLQKFWYRWPGMVYGYTIWAGSLKDAKEKIKRTWEFKRLPNHTEVWR